MGLEWLWLLGSFFLCYFSICVDIHLESQPNISGYIKRLILEDMKRSE